MYIASLVLGIISLLTSWFPVFGFIISIIALIVAIIAMVKKKPEGKGMGIAGMILSIIAVIISLIVSLAVFGSAYYLTERSEDIIDKAQTAIALSDKSIAKDTLTRIYVEVSMANRNTEYTGYINEETMEYTDWISGIEIDEYYENKLKDDGYDYDVNVDLNGIPSIEE